MVKGFYIELVKVVLLIIFCHMIGDYVMQTDYMSREKGKNLWVLFVHCVCYCVPFYVCFGLRWQLAVIFVTHLIIDWGKEWKHWYGIFYDQYFHIMIALVYVLPVFKDHWRYL